MSPNPFCAALVSLSDGLKPTEEVERRGNTVFDRLVGAILSKSKIPVRRVAKVGSMGKHTAISVKLDYDCIFFIDEKYSRERFLEGVNVILTTEFDLDLRQTNKTDTFFYEGFSFDFLAACFVDENPTASVEKIIALSGGASETLKVGLTEGTVVFMKEQTSTVHQLARLLKFWSHTLLIPGFFNGRSFTMELFAVLASEEISDDPDLLCAFRVALRTIRDWRRTRKVWTRFYDRATAERALGAPGCGEGPLLLDPTDPTNNLLGPKRHAFFEQMGQFAEVTLQRLEVAERCVLFADLFAPQPKVWDTLPHVPKKGQTIVGWPQAGMFGMPKLAVQPFVRGTSSFQRELLVLAHCLYSMMVAENSGANSQRGQANGDGQQRQVEACVARLLGIPDVWCPATQRIEDKDAVLIPAGRAE